MAQILGLNQVRAKLGALIQEAHAANVCVVVGYTAAYALYVHENIEMKLRGQPRPRRLGMEHGKYWGPQGQAQAKFLEQPARQYASQIGRIVITAYGRTRNMAQSLIMGGLFLQRESMKLVPVDTGNLRASAFTRVE